MKKVLLATTVITTAAVLAAAPASAEGIDISMWSTFAFSAGDSDNSTSADRLGHDFATNTEIKFSGSTKMDNGITVGFVIELEADSGNNDDGSATVTSNDIDENHISFSGNFGEVILGNQDGAADAGKISGSSVGVAVGGIGNPTATILGSLRAIAGGGSNTSGVWLLADGGDDTKITYFTPKISGFKAGLSYTPAGSAYNKAWGGHLSYGGEFNGVSVGAVLNGAIADDATDVVGTSQQTHIDAVGWMFGAKLGYMGFSLAGGYSSNDNVGTDRQTNTLVGADHDTFSIGVGYASGPMSVAIAGMWDEEDLSNNDMTEYSISLKYSLGSGVSVFASGLMGEVDVNTAGTTNTDYSMVTIGTSISF